MDFGIKEFFENEAKMATRLANFISAFLQISDPHEVYSGKRVADRPLTEDQMIGETLALVLGDTKIWSAGTFWDRNKFTNRTFFAPYAYKTQLNTRKFKVEDLARLNDTGKYVLCSLPKQYCFSIKCHRLRTQRTRFQMKSIQREITFKY